MLLRFGVSNHRSILDYQELLLTASRRIGRDRATISVPTMAESALTVAAVYGANASGKSNLLDALSEFKRSVLGSHTHLGVTDPIPRSPFLLDPSALEQPTRFDCTFALEGATTARERHRADQSVYEYGFEYTDREIQREWLLRIVRKERRSTQVLFERETRNGRVQIDFGNHLRGENKTIANLTRPNSLFLSTGAQNNHPQLTELYRFFTERWQIYRSEEPASDSSIAKRLPDYEHKEQLLELLRKTDVGIGDIVVQDTDHSDDLLELAGDIADAIWKKTKQDEKIVDLEKQRFIKDMSERKSLRFVHASANGASTHFKYDLESKGTRTLISLLIPALEALSRGALLVVDELDTSLHPDLVRAFVSLFGKSESNPRGAQLVFSTHDTTLLGSGLLLQDQIWMTDKNTEGVSSFTPLTDFRLRSRDDLEKAYRKRRLGGVPTSDDFFLQLKDMSAP